MRNIIAGGAFAAAGIAAPAQTHAAGHPPTVYVLDDSGRITIFHKGRQSQISGPYRGEISVRIAVK